MQRDVSFINSNLEKLNQDNKKMHSRRKRSIKTNINIRDISNTSHLYILFNLLTSNISDAENLPQQRRE